MAKPRDIGVDVEPPAKEGKPGDPLDPFYGTLSVRGQVLVGQVTSTKMQSSCIVTREYLRYVPKYERYEKRTSKYTAHVPSCIDVREGDLVKIMECRPISKTKSFVVIEAKRGELKITGQDATVPATEASQ
jgi:small subunit ribosomal protein S17